MPRRRVDSSSSSSLSYTNVGLQLSTSAPGHAIVKRGEVGKTNQTWEFREGYNSSTRNKIPHTYARRTYLEVESDEGKDEAFEVLDEVVKDA